jgi:ethanolamine utilization protein EutQ (cupin superfamily)
VIEVMNLTINGKIVQAPDDCTIMEAAKLPAQNYKGGDIFFIPMNTSITFGTPDYCKFFFTAYPANWQELSNKK